MHCPTCGTAVPDRAVFCHQCGARLDGNDTAVAARTTERDPKDWLRSAISREDHAETMLWSGGYSSRAMIGSWIGAILATVGLLVLWALLVQMTFPLQIVLAIVGILWSFLGLLLVFRKLNHHYELTNLRFVHSTGILRRVTDRIEAIDMDDVSYEQGIIERILNTGLIRITSSDRSHSELSLNGIYDVQNVANLIDNVRHQERLRRGLHIEAV